MDKKNKSNTENIKPQYNEFFSIALDLFCIADTNGYFIQLNKSWEESLGYSLGELEGARFLDYVHPDDLPKTLHVLGELSEQKEVLNFENRYRCKDGSYRWIEWRSRPVGDFIYAAARDITERKEMVAALQESEAKYRILLDESVDPIFIIGADGTYYYVNLAFAKGVNRELRDIINKKIWDVFPIQEAEQRFTAVREVIRTGQAKVIEVKVATAKGTDFYVTTIQPILKEDKTILSVMCSSKNITERKMVEEALKNSEERFSKIFYQNPEAMSINYLETRKFAEINPAFTNLFGYTSEEVKGRTAAKDDLNLWVNDDEIKNMTNALLNEQVVEMETEWRRKNGSIFIGLLSVKIIEINNEKFYLTSNKDITQQKINETELKNAAHQKELMLKELQHRIKNNLNVLSGLLSIAQEGLEDEKSRSIFSDALSRITTMSSIYQHLYKSPDFEKIDLHSYLEGLTETLFNLYNVGNSEIKLATNFNTLSIDSKRAEALALILNELVSNALKYAFKNVQDGKLQIDLTRNNKEVILTVQDNGPGLPEEFDIQTNDSLGLKLVKLLTKQIEGELKFESQNGLKVQVLFQV